MPDSCPPSPPCVQGALNAIKPILASHAPVHICAMLCQCLGAIGNADEASSRAVATSGCLQLMVETTYLSTRELHVPNHLTSFAPLSPWDAAATCVCCGLLPRLLGVPFN